MAAVILFGGGVLGPLLLMLGLSLTSAASGALLLNLEGIATMAIAWTIFRENVDRRLTLGAATIVLGAAALAWSGHGVSVDLGAAFFAAACLSWGIDNNLTRKLSSADPVQIIMVKGLAAGAVNLAIGLMRGADLPSVEIAGAAALAGFFGRC
jgi:drug/metabolite transporter (DMT)-like permease